MKAINQLRTKLQSMGASLDDSSGYTLYCDAAPGYVWASTGNAQVTIHYATNSQSWLVKAIKDAMDDLGGGLRLASDEEREQIEWNNDEEWKAPAGAPATISW